MIKVNKRKRVKKLMKKQNEKEKYNILINFEFYFLDNLSSF